LNLIRDIKIQKSVRDHFGNYNFRNPIAVTLTLKQSISICRGSSFQKVSIDSDKASQNLRHFFNLINSQYLGKKATRFGHRIPAISILEGTKSKRYHYHLLIDWPTDQSSHEIWNAVSSNWQKTQWGYGQIDVTTNADGGWIDYITKIKDKEDFASSIDWENISRPE